MGRDYAARGDDGVENAAWNATLGGGAGCSLWVLAGYLAASGLSCRTRTAISRRLGERRRLEPDPWQRFREGDELSLQTRRIAGHCWRRRRSCFNDLFAGGLDHHWRRGGSIRGHALLCCIGRARAAAPDLDCAAKF